jgi:choice-of-anchor C domain-containing protein
MNRNILGAAAFALVFVAGAANAATIVNGSFELGTDPGAGFSTETAGSIAITGWDVAGFGVDYIGGYWQASDGVRSIDLSGNNAGSVSQSFATTVGTTYTVNFDLSGNPDAGTGNKISVISISGSLPTVQIYDVLASNSRDAMNWQNYSYTFTAFATSSTLTFASAEYNPYGPALDNVSILESGGSGSFVPEPASWAMMVAGFGLVGLSARRRGVKTVTA